MKRLLVGGIVALGLMIGPGRVTHAQTAIDPSKFALTAWDFPAPAHIIKGQVETNDVAAHEDVVMHFGAKSFADEGRVSGYFMESSAANLDTSGSEHPVLTYYLVSTFPSADQAAAAFAQQRDGWEEEATSPTADVQAKVVDLAGQKFGDQQPRGLYVAPISTSDGQVDVSELLFQRGAYLVEVWNALLDKDVAAYGADAQSSLFAIGKKLDAVASGTLTSVTPPANPPVDFSILSARFEKHGSDSSKWNLKQQPLTSVKTGTEVQLAMYFVVKSAPANARYSDEYRLTMGKRTLHKSYSHHFGAYPPDYYHYYLYNLKLPRAGTYTFTGTIKINGVSHSAKASIKVTGKSVTAVNLRPATGRGSTSQRSLEPMQRAVSRLRLVNSL